MVTIIKKLTGRGGEGKRNRKRRNGEKKGGRKREGGKRLLKTISKKITH